MESELWYLVLIPVLFAAGWWARGLDAGEREPTIIRYFTA